jgi:hypothetical protein
MKLSTNLQSEVKLHLFWLTCQLPAAVLAALLFNMRIFDAWPLWAKIALPALCAGLSYFWWRQGLSPDKKTFKPRIWK